MTLIASSAVFKKMPNGSSGFSLIEVMVAVSLIAVLAGLAAPSFTGLFQRYRVDAVREDLIATIQLARAESVRRGQAVMVEKQSSCAVTLSTGENWSCGWIVYPDLNGNGSRDAVTEPILQTTDLPNNVTVVKNSATPLNRFTSDRFGQIQPIALSFLISPSGGTTANGVILCKGAGSRVRAIKGATTCS
jgi:type IV fimbrial biogenesis protein FimT